MDVLNLGCGNKPKADAINHDIVKHRPEISVAWDLNDRPWPWADCSFDMIFASAVLEHLRITLVESLGECWRILRAGGQLHVKVPYWQHDNAYADPTHHWQFSPRVFHFFDPETKLGREYGFYAGARPWRLIKAPYLNDAGSSVLATLEVRK